jgi:hypothetical protein
MEKKHLLKQLGKPSGPGANKSKILSSLPGMETLQKTFKKTTKKQYLDVALFSVALIVMYHFGKEISSRIDEWVPSEQQIMDMM